MTQLMSDSHSGGLTTPTRPEDVAHDAERGVEHHDPDEPHRHWRRDHREDQQRAQYVAAEELAVEQERDAEPGGRLVASPAAVK